MNGCEKLRLVEEAWRDGSDEENFYFAGFDQPKKLRRSRRFPGALTALTFGSYQDFDGHWVQDSRIVWLDMIVGDRPAYAGALLDDITSVLRKNGLGMIGSPTFLRPRDWSDERRGRKDTELLAWYMKRGFKIVQNSQSARIVHCEYPLSLVSEFKIDRAKHDETRDQS